MGWVETLVFRSIQFGALLGVLLGLSNIPTLVSEVQTAIAKNNWDIGRLGCWFIAVTGPTLLGGLLLAAMQAIVHHATASAPLERAHPREPWLWRPDWAEGRVRLSNRVVWIGLGIMWSFYFLVALPGAATMMALKNFEWSVTTFLGCFVGFMGLIFLAFTKQGFANRKWNRSELRLASVPGVIGGPISGVVVLADKPPPGSIFRVTLVCERTHSTRRVGSSDDHDSNRVDVVWQSQKMIDGVIETGSPDSTGIPFHFAIDYDCVPTGRDTITGSRMFSKHVTKESIHWWVKIALRDDPKMREAKFEVPVFKTPKSSPDYVEDVSLVAPYLGKADPEKILSRVGFRRQHVAGGERLEFSIFKWSIVFGILLLLTFCGAGLAAAILLPPKLPVKLFAAAIPGFIFLASLYGLIETLLWKASVTILVDRVDVESTWLGLGWLGKKGHASGPRDDPPRLVVEEEFRKSDGAWWSVRFVDDRSKRHTLVSRLDGQQEAQAIRDWLQKEMGARGENAEEERSFEESPDA